MRVGRGHPSKLVTEKNRLDMAITENYSEKKLLLDMTILEN